MIEVLIVAMMALAASAWTLSALRRKDDDQALSPGMGALDRKKRALEALLDLEDDVATGKVSLADGAALKTEHVRAAAEALRELEASADDASIEAAIARARAELRRAPG